MLKRHLALALLLVLLNVTPHVTAQASQHDVDGVEAVGLTEAHPESAQDEAKRMEGLLHWAICKLGV